MLKVKSDPDKGPTLIRLAWHSSGTYDKMSKTGGSQLGTIRFKEEFSHGGNAGLADTAILWMEDIKKKYGDGLSYADLYTLAGVVAVKSLGGPQVPWNSGRKDSLTPNDVTPDGRLPAADSGPAGADRKSACYTSPRRYVGFRLVVLVPQCCPQELIETHLPIGHPDDKVGSGLWF